MKLRPMLIALLAFIGMIDALYLSIKRNSGPIPCHITRGCTDVLTSKYSEVAGVPLTAEDIEPLDCMDEVMRRPQLAVTFEMERGDMQFVNNVFILHSRAEYQDHPEIERKRHYMRLWLKYR